MPKRERLERPVAVGRVLKGLMRPGDWHTLELRQRVRVAWEQAVPEGLREQARLVDLKRQELWVEVGSSAWGQELQFLKPRILEAMEKLLGPGVIRDLRFKVGERRT